MATAINNTVKYFKKMYYADDSYRKKKIMEIVMLPFILNHYRRIAAIINLMRRRERSLNSSNFSINPLLKMTASLL
jgi:hypothetical protein